MSTSLPLQTSDSSKDYKFQFEELIAKLKYRKLILTGDGIEPDIRDKKELVLEEWIELFDIAVPFLKRVKIFEPKNRNGSSAYEMKHFMTDILEATYGKYFSPRGGYYFNTGAFILLMYICGYEYTVKTSHKIPVGGHFKLGIPLHFRKSSWV